MKVEFRSSFARDIRRLRDRVVKERVRTTIAQVESAKTLDEISNIRKLTGSGDYYRIRIGEYRIGLLLDQDVVVFVRCLPRRDIYRYFP